MRLVWRDRQKYGDEKGTTMWVNGGGQGEKFSAGIDEKDMAWKTRECNNMS